MSITYQPQGKVACPHCHRLINGHVADDLVVPGKTGRPSRSREQCDACRKFMFCERAKDGTIVVIKDDTQTILGPRTRSAALAHRYGTSERFPHGIPFDPATCAAEVAGGNKAKTFFQCSNKPGKGPDQLFCTRHNPETHE